MEYKKLKDICDVFISRPIIDKEHDENSFLLTPSNLLSNNIIIEMDKVCISKRSNAKFLLRTGDILIKRLNPVFVNVFDQNDYPTYASSNIIIVRPKDDNLSKYIAAVFYIYGIDTMTHYVRRGVTIQALSAKELAEIRIPLVPVCDQKKIGELWSLYQRKSSLKEKLDKYENIYMRNAFKKILSEEN